MQIAHLSSGLVMRNVERDVPKAGQESVWDYPRPPKLEKVHERLRVEFNLATIADTTSAYRVLETSHPPVYYIPPADIQMKFLTVAPGNSWCEFKGRANYWSLHVNGRASENAAWSYTSPTQSFILIAGFFAFYASRVDACWFGDEQVQAQASDFYGGWVTSKIVGPFKGPPGTNFW